MVTSLLTIVDVAVQIAGALIAVVFFAWVLRSGWPSDPLVRLSAPTYGPGLVHAAIILLAYGLIQSLLLRVFAQGSALPATAGSDVWHRLQTADAIARLAVAAAMVWIVIQTTNVRRRPASAAVAKLALATCAAFPALLVVCLAQAEFATAVWGWFEPLSEAPQHDLLTAFRQSDWGYWGRLQLTAIAVIVAPIAEELFFRGILLPAIWRLTGLLWPAIVLSAAFFALVHSAYPQTVLPMFTFGVVLGALWARTGSLAACALLHALFNGRTMLLVAFHPEILTSASS